MERLVCFDLDNTLIDRDAAFAAWARWVVGRAGLGADAVEWLVAQDNGGFQPREELFAGFGERYGVVLSVAEYDREHPRFTWAEPEVLDGLANLRANGWRVAVVTNGTVVQQTGKLQHTGIAKVVDFCCISEAVGVRKPDRRIFELAAEHTNTTLTDGWMVGDHPAYDVQGGINAGLHTIQVGTRRRPEAPAPDHRVDNILEAFGILTE
ncbi:HAD family hydrolase [Kribbella sp. NPDC048915]|uniref:HAD family hydrolase n=1 Tax=Kribbella sp. NPDC048915 TaxID=3155148 RepID=UPI0033C54247